MAANRMPLNIGFLSRSGVVATRQADTELGERTVSGPAKEQATPALFT
jgi:hypothetical protein